MDNLDPIARKHDIKGTAILAIDIPDETCEPFLLLLQVLNELACFLGHPRLRRMSGHIGYVNTARPAWMMKKT